MKNLKKGLFFIISAPAGGGKTTLVKKLEKDIKNVVRSISYTTRKPRKNEIDGKDYFFISKEEFKKKVKKEEFLEYAKVFENYYGSSKKFIKENIKKKHIILTIDTQGAMKLKKNKTKNSIFIFIKPLNISVLKKRLEKRKSEKKEEIKKRLFFAKYEMEMAKNYDYIILNEDLDISYQILKSIIIAEQHKKRNVK
jgi:guanylate kinase